MSKNIDWKKIKKEYVTTTISQRDISRKYGVSLAQIANHSKKENWVEKREQYQNKIYTKSVEKQESKDIDRLERVKSSADRLGVIIDSVLEQTETMSKSSRVRLSSAKDIRSMTAAVKDLAVVLKELYGTKDEDTEDTGVILLAPVKEEEDECYMETTTETD